MRILVGSAWAGRPRFGFWVWSGSVGESLPVSGHPPEPEEADSVLHDESPWPAWDRHGAAWGFSDGQVKDAAAMQDVSGEGRVTSMRTLGRAGILIFCLTTWESGGHAVTYPLSI